MDPVKLAQIEGGVVVNVIEARPDAVPAWAQAWPEAGEAGPGWGWDGATFTPPPEPDPAEVLAAWRAAARVSKLALVRHLRTVDLALAPVADPALSAWAAVQAALAAPGSEEAAEDWALAVEIARLDPIMAAFALGLPWPQGADPDLTLDTAFRAAGA